MLAALLPFHQFLMEKLPRYDPLQIPECPRRVVAEARLDEKHSLSAHARNPVEPTCPDFRRQRARAVRMEMRKEFGVVVVIRTFNPGLLQHVLGALREILTPLLPQVVYRRVDFAPVLFLVLLGRPPRRGGRRICPLSR